MEQLPLKFIQNLDSHFGSEIRDRILDGLNSEPSVSVRLNSSKPSNRFENEKPVPWSNHGRLLTERPNFALDPLFHAGVYYVQDSSSMVLEEVLRQLEFDHDGILALDACAAPGGKSIILSDYLSHKGFLICNEVDTKRNNILSENLMKWGSAHHGVTQLSSEKIASLHVTFDLILVDAPCSGEGMFRKDDYAIKQWSDSLVEQCALTQRNVLNDLSDSINEGGYLIYSTCTMNPHENETQVERLIQEGFEIALPDLSDFVDFILPANGLGYYLLPGISTGEGLFISVLRKTGISSSKRLKQPMKLKPFDQQSAGAFSNTQFTNQWTKSNEAFGVIDPFGVLSNIPANMPFKSLGLPAFEIKGKDTIPLHGLAMTPTSKLDVNLNLEQALEFLRKNNISLENLSNKKWLLLGYEGIALGWVKNIPGRLNNYYPSHFRLRS
ncbi:MAG: hypothetical protein R2813_07305 [Flavobacteriales bacterium]